MSARQVGKLSILTVLVASAVVLGLVAGTDVVPELAGSETGDGTGAGSVVDGGTENDTRREASITVCDGVPDRDYERIVYRVERIMDERLQRNLTICTVDSEAAIDTTPDSGRFARVGPSGLELLGVDPSANVAGRSSLGSTSFSPSGGPVTIRLANESVVENVSWLSYEALVVHELSSAVSLPGRTNGTETSPRSANRRSTTDRLLAQQAFGNGVSLYVADRYVRRYGGHLDASALADRDRTWKRQVLQSVYYHGYRYSRARNVTSFEESDRIHSTSQILHPDREEALADAPARPDVPDSFDHDRTDRVGELFARELLRANGVAENRAATATEGWGIDRMDYFRNGSTTLVTWRVTWDDPGELSAFLTAYDPDYTEISSLRAVSCHDEQRYLVTSGRTMTLARCSS